ncbi:hypothetical protein IGI04_019028 [Brassica rapa subsp. trilocularis]|uniref:Uncharacterized protein n=1 Tax=Brassica rapa subsp. trilocularis TaxID=1813537 RepID=A0ABQ7MI07_BRACM|nr:hypothetical protein IGI04_019028 [Brassica rapa subsp. trilocularis]
MGQSVHKHDRNLLYGVCARGSCTFWSFLRCRTAKIRHKLLMDGYLFTVRLSSYFDTRSIFALAFQCNRFEVSQYPISEVMPVLLKSGWSASREEAVED